MTIDEAIRHCEEVAEKMNDCECAADHRQLTEWLRELKALRGKIADICSILAAYYGCPCDYSPQDEIMEERGNCEDCGEISNAECWSRFLETEIQLNREGIQDNTNKMYAEIKDLREENKVLISECDRLIKEKGELLKKSEQIAEYKRLLKVSVEDIRYCMRSYDPCEVCALLKDNGECAAADDDDCEEKYKWRCEAEALKLIGEDGEQNE